MKNLKTIAIALLVAFSTAAVSAQTKKVDVAKSKVEWVGKKSNRTTLRKRKP
jgi:hypothetical protein